MYQVKIAVILLPVFVINCISASVIRYPGLNFPPADPDKVQIFQLEPPTKYIRIGEVSASTSEYVDMESIYEELRKKAAEIGGHAIINLKTERILSRIGRHGRAYYKYMVSGVVIRFTELENVEGSDNE
jgi:hypothetical protein